MELVQSHRTDKKREYREGREQQPQIIQRGYWKVSIEFVRLEVNGHITQSSFSGVVGLKKAKKQNTVS